MRDFSGKWRRNRGILYLYKQRCGRTIRARTETFILLDEHSLYSLPLRYSFFQQNETQEARGKKNRRYVAFLRRLWEKYVRHVLITIYPSAVPRPAELSRMWWIGVGVASSLPFHAASNHSAGASDNNGQLGDLLVHADHQSPGARGRTRIDFSNGRQCAPL